MDSHPETSPWVAARLATLAPDWEPSLARGRARVAAHAPAPRRAWRYGLATAAAALLLVSLAPSGRALAQDLWYRWFVTRVAVVRLDTSKMPLDTHVLTADFRSVSSLAEAAAKAGFTPVLPPAGVTGGEPQLTVIGRFDVTQRIRTADFEAALRREGATDVEVPAEWNGVTLRAAIGPIVAATYPGDVEVVQTTPIRLEMPADFPLQRFAEAAFRSAGLSWQEARQLAEDFAAQPAWLLDVPADAAVSVETVSLPAGSGVLIIDADDPGSEHAKVIISRRDRLYGVTSPSRELSLRVASALR
jgi:hypothetical protein